MNSPTAAVHVSPPLCNSFCGSAPSRGRRRQPACQGQSEVDPIGGCIRTMAARVEMLADRGVGGEKPLCLPRRLEPLHLSFSSSRRLVRILGPIVEIAALPVLDALEGLLPCRAVARQLVGDDRPRDEARPFQQLAEEPLCRPGIAAALDEDIEDHPGLVHRPPEIMPDAADPDEHLIEVPLVARLRSAAAQFVGEGLGELAAPLPNRLVADGDARSASSNSTSRRLDENV